jgi:hypothetical protein
VNCWIKEPPPPCSWWIVLSGECLLGHYVYSSVILWRRICKCIWIYSHWIFCSVLFEYHSRVKTFAIALCLIKLHRLCLRFFWFYWFVIPKNLFLRCLHKSTTMTIDFLLGRWSDISTLQIYIALIFYCSAFFSLVCIIPLLFHLLRCNQVPYFSGDNAHLMYNAHDTN